MNGDLPRVCVECGNDEAAEGLPVCTDCAEDATQATPVPTLGT